MTEKSNEKAVLSVGSSRVELPVVIGTEGEKAIDISKLHSMTGMLTVDPGLANTASCYSRITYIDGERGILRYRGIPIEELVGHVLFIDVAYLLVHGSLPGDDERTEFSKLLNEYSLMHEDMRHFFDRFPRQAHPMHILSSMIGAMAAFYPNVDLKSIDENIDEATARVVSIVRTMAAFVYKKSIGEPLVYPRCDLSFCANFLNMMFNSPVKPYEIRQETVSLLNVLLILHADHEQNCSTTAVRVVGSAQANLYSTISTGVSALSGPLHGGANQAVIEMLRAIHKDGDVGKFIKMAKDKESPFRLMGFGHRVYKTYDPRAEIIRKECDKYLKLVNYSDPLLDVARRVEEAALTDPYFIDRHLYPNVDFYSGILYRAMGIPENMFTVMFAMARLPGWVAHWKEMIGNNTKIVRPRQIYLGEGLTPAKDLSDNENEILI